MGAEPMGRRGFFRLAAGAVAIAAGLGAPKKVAEKVVEKFSATWTQDGILTVTGDDADVYEFMVQFSFSAGLEDPVTGMEIKAGDGPWQPVEKA